jgi:cysteinyl-tRNA synthetase
VIYHRTQAAALAWLEGDEEVDTDRAIEEVNKGLETLRELFIDYDAEEQYEEDDLVVRLIEFREGVRERYEIGMTLREQLEKAIEDEDYEKAAELRDQLESKE